MDGIIENDKTTDESEVYDICKNTGHYPGDATYTKADKAMIRKRMKKFQVVDRILLYTVKMAYWTCNPCSCCLNLCCITLLLLLSAMHNLISKYL